MDAHDTFQPRHVGGTLDRYCTNRSRAMFHHESADFTRLTELPFSLLYKPLDSISMSEPQVHFTRYLAVGYTSATAQVSGVRGSFHGCDFSHKLVRGVHVELYSVCTNRREYGCRLHIVGVLLAPDEHPVKGEL